jgi:hypothetical protein
MKTGGGAAVRAAKPSEAPRQRTWGEPIFAENWGEPAGLESCAAARHTWPIRDEPLSTATGTSTPHSASRCADWRRTNSDDDGDSSVECDTEREWLVTVKNTVGGDDAAASWLALWT